MEVLYQQKKSSFLIEVNVYLHPSWGKMPGMDADIVTYNPGTKYPFYYVAIDGSKYQKTYYIQKDIDSNIAIHWTEVIQNLIARKMLPAPIGGLHSIVSEAVFIATEVRNDRPGTGGPVVDLHFRNFRQGGF